MTDRRLALVALLFLLPGCVGDGANNADSALGEGLTGVPISIASDPFLVVGTVSGDTLYELAGVTTPFLLPEGSLVVPLETAGVIRLFDANGEFLEALGRPGEGPGEFRRLSTAWPRGDTIEAYDTRLARVTRFLPGGSIATVPIEQGAGARVVPGALTDGWVLSRVAGPIGDGVRDRVAFVRASATGSYLGEVASLGGIERHFTPGFSGPGPLSFVTRSVVAGDRIYLAETEMPRIQVLNPSGELEREIVWQPAPLPTPERALQLIVDSAVVRSVTQPGPPIEERIAAFPATNQVPSFWDMRVDERGFVWVQPFEPGRHSVWYSWLRGGSRSWGPWSVFSPDGVPVGTIVIPEGLTVTQISDTTVVGVYFDELGVEFVHAYRLERN